MFGLRNWAKIAGTGTGPLLYGLGHLVFGAFRPVILATAVPPTLLAGIFLLRVRRGTVERCRPTGTPEERKAEVSTDSDRIPTSLQHPEKRL